MKMDVHGLLRLFSKSARILIILVCFESLQAGPLQDAAGKNGCFQYQDPTTIEPLKKYVEPAMDQGCVACHLDCSQLSAADQENPPEYYLKAKEPELCMDCHATLDKDLAPAHDNQPFEKSKCTGCHDPHSSDMPKLLLPDSHGPYAARLCSACHPAPVDGKIGLTDENVDTLCYSCHTNFKEEIAGAGSRHKVLSESDRACMECHDPHAARQEYVLKKPAQDLCLDCHIAKPGQAAKQQSVQGRALPPDLAANSKNPDTQYLELSSKFVHEPAEKSCLICHDAHASEYPRELRVPVHGLCMDCHGENAEKIVQSNKPFPLFNGLVSLPPKMFEKLTRFELEGKYVHEPVNISCTLCHDAHGSDYEKGLYAPLQELCLACHGPNAVGMYRTDQPYPLFGGRVIVPPKPFDNLKILNLGNGMVGHPAANHPVSGPATKDYKAFNCSSCHRPHSASTGPALLVSPKETLCTSSCHEL